MKTTITVGQSVQVINIGQPEHWNKFGIERTYDSEVNELAVIDELVALMQKAHEKYSKSEYPDVVPNEVPKKKMTIDVLKVYEAAMKSNDQKVINQIQNEYHVIA